MRVLFIRLERSSDRHQGDLNDSERSSTGRGHEGDLDRGPMENVELMSEEERRVLAEKLESVCCEMALALVYSDGSTQLRETAANAKVRWFSV